MFRALWSRLAFRLFAVWTVVAVIALGVWLSGMPLFLRAALLGVLLVVQWRTIDRVTGLRARAAAAKDPE